MFKLYGFFLREEKQTRSEHQRGAFPFFHASSTSRDVRLRANHNPSLRIIMKEEIAKLCKAKQNSNILTHFTALLAEGRVLSLGEVCNTVPCKQREFLRSLQIITPRDFDQRGVASHSSYINLGM